MMDYDLVSTELQLGCTSSNRSYLSNRALSPGDPWCPFIEMLRPFASLALSPQIFLQIYALHIRVCVYIYCIYGISAYHYH